MNKSEIKKEILSVIKIDLDETLFYIPGETVKGKIKLFPTINLKLKDHTIHFKLKLIQYEFWEYSNVKLTELKNIHKTEIKEKFIEYKLNDDEISKFEEKVNLLEFSVIFIKNENKENFISIPFEFKIDSENEKLLPTFQFETEKYFLGIRHLITVESFDYSSINHTGIFIGKSRNKFLLKEKEIKNTFSMGVGLSTLDVKIIIPKETFYFGEEMPFKIESNSNLLFQKVTKIEPNFYRKIEWVGYMKNSLLDKKDISGIKFNYNEDKFGLFSKLMLPIEILELTSLTKKGIFGGIFGVLNFFDLTSDLQDYYEKFKDILRLNAKTKEFKENEHFISDFNKTVIKNCTEKELKEINEEMKKYIYFKDDKVIGFVKFIKDITPPVNGYYFNCNFNFKINIHISGVVLDQEKSLKNTIEMYDGEEYIKKMKNLLKVD